MALLSPQLQRFISTSLCRHDASSCRTSASAGAAVNRGGGGGVVSVAHARHRCSAIAIEAPSSMTDVAPIRFGYTSLQGPREEMEDAIVIRSDGLDGFSFAAVFDGHAGSSSVRFLSEELYKECVGQLQGGSLLSGGDFTAIKEALLKAFENVDQNLLKWLEANGEEDESGSTATVLFIRNGISFISHIGDSCVVLSRSGQAEELIDSHRPFGSSKASLQEIRRIREAGGWIVNGRICGDIAVSRAFGDIRFKTKKYEMLQKGVEEGRWSEKFVSRIRFKGDLVIATPEIYQVPLASDVEFVVLASDGLWDYMNRFPFLVSLSLPINPLSAFESQICVSRFSSDVVKYVRDQLRKHGNVQLACEALAQAALDQRSQDNISIIIADIGRTDWRNLPVQKPNTVLELVQALATIGIVSFGIWMSSYLSL
ncbi:PREDICTED: protein phosphatase 2C 57 isoform X1 [Tarenaya hassleriana]|uniref:protein phosphatase 2C 57 isoform X1 n=1 Tax=Tarenaya hassleriana TaxID=28532 RepID=UPI00053C3CEA|nr:PREDICTED: protein phosphatase 2C 57 isoform X1 [Tarenaya hassleriana]